MFNTLSDAIHWIETRIRFRPKADLSKIKQAYALLGINFNDTKKIHVAGTNGKGSVCQYLTNYAHLKNIRVGTFTSPYVIIFNERIKINNMFISDEVLFTYINYIYDFNEAFSKDYGESLTFFELITLIAFKYFYDEKVDAIIMEVGIGGLLDATNIISYDLSLITNIGWDHMKQLGNTLESIAKNKLGILKKSGHLITTVDQPLWLFFEDYAKRVDASIEIIKSFPKRKSSHPVRIDFEGHEYVFGLHGDYQIKNAMLAIRAGRLMFGNLEPADLHYLILRTKLHGRFSMVLPTVYIDGAHNISGMRALVDYLKTINREFLILYSALADKDINGMLNILQEASNRIVLTAFPDVRFTSLRGFLKEGMSYNENPIDALKQLELERDTNQHQLILITGSLHFVSYMYQTIKKTCLDERHYREKMNTIETNYIHDNEGEF